MTGRKAVLPGADAFDPAAITDDGLVLTVVAEEASTPFTIDVRDWPGSVTVRQQLVRAFSVLCGPTGSWRSSKTAIINTRRLKPLAEWLDGREVDDLSDLTGDDWSGPKGYLVYLDDRYTPDTRNSSAMAARTVLQVFGERRTDLSRALNRRYMVPVADNERDFYTLDVIRELKVGALRELRSAEQRIGLYWDLVHIPADQLNDEDRVKRQAVIDVLVRGKPRTIAGYRALNATVKESDGKGGTRQCGRMVLARRALFLTPQEFLAVVTAIMIETGENRSTIMNRKVALNDATIANSDLTAHSSVLYKRRRPVGSRHMAENALEPIIDLRDTPPPPEDDDLSGDESEPGDSGTEDPVMKPALGPLISRVTALTEPARYAARHRPDGAAHHDRLLLRIDQTNRFVNNPRGEDAARWNSSWLPDSIRSEKRPNVAAGDPGGLNFMTLHRSVEVLVLNKPVHNTPSTFLEEYLKRGPGWAEQIAQKVESATNAMIDRARGLPTMRIMSAEEASHKIASGEMDTAVGACADIDSHPDTGKPCEHDDFLMCLGCRNGVATDRHLPLLVTLLDELERIRELPSLMEKVWENTYALHWARLIVILKPLSDAQWADARGKRTDGHVRDVADVLTGRGWRI